MTNLLSNLFIKLLLIAMVLQWRSCTYHATYPSSCTRHVYKGSVGNVYVLISNGKPFKKLPSTNSRHPNHHNIISLLLICSGDISLNPGPGNTEFTKKFKPFVRSLIYKTIKTQEKFIESSLHGHFLQKYQEENVPPPGLRIQKTPEITNSHQVTKTWDVILNETSLELNKVLIDAHNKNTSELAKKLKEQREELMGKLNTEEKVEMQSWFQQQALKYRDNTKERKLKKFDNHIKDYHQNKVKSNPVFTPEHATSSSDSSTHVQESSSSTHNLPGITVNRKRKNRRTHREHVLKEVTVDEAANGEDIIVNLSDYQLTEAETSVLRKGLKFIPTPTKINKTELLVDVKKFSRRMRLKEYFSSNDNNNIEHVHNRYKVSRFTPEHGRDRSLDSYLITLEETFKNIKGEKVKSNLTPPEREAIGTLRRNNSIVIMSADKGGALVIQNRDSYIEIAKEHLECLDADGNNVYQQMQSDITNDIAMQVNHVIDEAKNQSVIDEGTANGLKVDNPKAGNLYLLPKIHKNPESKRPPPRPICNTRNTPTEKISQWVDEQLQPLVKQLPSYLQDDSDFLRKVEEINRTHDLPPGTLLATWDVKSLYTNIPGEGGKKACRYFLENSGKRLCVISTIMKFIGLILNFNLFKFGCNIYIQRSGTAMGTKMAPSYANLFMGYLEKDLLTKCTHKPLVWFRYIDDVFLIWTHGKQLHDEFLNLANSNEYGMTFEVGKDSVSTTSVPFLDVNVMLRDGKLHTDLYIKPTDKFQYLEFSSCHPFHQKANLPFALALRIRRICSDPTNFKDHCDKLLMRLRNRGYKMGLIKEGIRKASVISREEALSKARDQPSQDRVIFSTAYNPMLPNLKEKLAALQPILSVSEKCKDIFPSPPLIAYRRNRSLNDILVSRRLPPDTQVSTNMETTNVDRTSNTCEICGRSFSNAKGKLIHLTRMHKTADEAIRPPGFSKCEDSRCSTCIKGVFGESVHVTETNETFLIRQRISCKTRNVVYCLTCRKCKEQYIGETSNEIHIRQAGHLSDIRQHKTGLPYVKHFLKCGIENYSITGVEKVRSNDPLIRKQRETFYKNVFKVKIK